MKPITKQLGYCNKTVIKHIQKKNKPTRIEVQSELYNLDTAYQDVTIDTAYEQWQQEELKQLFKGLC